jgi:hypothetical protein
MIAPTLITSRANLSGVEAIRGVPLTTSLHGLP